MKPAKQLGAQDIVEEFKRTIKPQARSGIATRRLRSYGPAQKMLAIPGVGGSTAVEILAKLFQWYAESFDEEMTLGEVLET